MLSGYDGLRAANRQFYRPVSRFPQWQIRGWCALTCAHDAPWEFLVDGLWECLA